MDLPNLESVLKNSIDEKVKLLDYKVSNLLSFGENFSSEILKVDAVINRNSKPENLHLMAKRGGKIEKYIVMWPESFQKEVFIYNELIPVYRELELEMGIKESERFKNLPAFYGYYATKCDGVEKIDVDSYFLMENLKIRDYYLDDRRVGLDYFHAKEALRSLARLSALGIAAKQKRPEFFEKAKSISQINNVDIDQLDKMFYNIWKVLCDIQPLEKYLPVIKKSLDFCTKRGTFITEENELWATITHGDPWINQMMFHKNKVTGEVDDVKLYDFQLYGYHSSQRDLSYFLSTNLDSETESKHIDDLIDWFYEHFMKTLKVMNCKTDYFTKEKFDVELRKNAMEYFVHHAMIVMLQVSNAVEEKDDDQYAVTMFEKQKIDDTIFIDRLLRLVRTYERKNWFNYELID